MQKDELRFEIWQDGLKVASGSGPRERASQEAAHYALMYGQDGPVEVKFRPIRALAGGE